MLLRERERERERERVREKHTHKGKQKQKRHEELKTLKPENRNTANRKNSKP
jgi:hypothetical protein